MRDCGYEIVLFPRESELRLGIAPQAGQAQRHGKEDDCYDSQVPRSHSAYLPRNPLWVDFYEIQYQISEAEVKNGRERRASIGLLGQFKLCHPLSFPQLCDPKVGLVLTDSHREVGAYRTEPGRGKTRHTKQRKQMEGSRLRLLL